MPQDDLFMAIKPIVWMKEFWKWLITSRYVRAMEAEVERLRAENRALMNSILGIAGIPPVIAPGDGTALCTRHRGSDRLRVRLGHRRSARDLTPRRALVGHLERDRRR